MDAVVIGSGPNGLTAAITLAQAGLEVCVVEAADVPGGGMRSAELTTPGFIHDICSAVHPMGLASPALRSFPLAKYGLEWVHPKAPLAHPFVDGSVVLVHRDIEETARGLGVDKEAYRKLMTPLVEHSEQLLDELLRPIHIPKHPLALARFGRKAIQPTDTFVNSTFRGTAARTMFAGIAAHSVLPLEKAGSAAFGLVLGMLAHSVGWPVARGGSQSIANALCRHFESLGGKIIVGRRVDSVDEFEGTRAILCDVTPRQLLKLAGHRFSGAYRRALERYRYGPGAFKIDWALRGPIPWKAPGCAESATVHLGASFGEIAASERTAWRGGHIDRPFLLLAQPTLFDPTRAPEGKHTAWAYCHVAQGSNKALVDEIESQVERFAPGFRQLIAGRHIFTASSFEQHNPNLVGGDINGGVQDLWQLFVRPSRRLYRTSAKGIYICSASTPPGGGVHGMCGYGAAQAVMKDLGLQGSPA